MARAASSRNALEWYYLDSMGQEYGPFESEMMRGWFIQGFFPTGEELLVRLPTWRHHVPLRQAYPDGRDFFFIGQPQLPQMQQMPRAAAAAAPPPPPPPLDGYGAFPEMRLGEEIPPYPAPAQFGAYWMMPAVGPGGFPVPAAAAPPAAYGFPPMMQQGVLPPMQPQPGPCPGRPAAPRGPGVGGAPAGRFRGRIKSFNGKQGFGFIESPDAYAIFGRDVFLHKAQIGDLRVGTEVTYTVEMNKQGMPQARELETLDGHPPGPSPLQRTGKGAGGPGGGGGGGAGVGSRGKGGSGGKGNPGGGKGRRKGGPGAGAGNGRAAGAVTGDGMAMPGGGSAGLVPGPA